MTSSNRAAAGVRGIADESPDGWHIRLRSPAFVDGRSLLFVVSCDEEQVVVDGPRYEEDGGERRIRTLPRKQSGALLTQIDGLLDAGWEVDLPWRREDAHRELARALCGSTLRPIAFEHVVSAIETGRLSRWSDLEAAVDLSALARTLRVDRVSLWAEPGLSRWAWAFTSSTEGDLIERANLCSRFRIA